MNWNVDCNRNEPIYKQYCCLMEVLVVKQVFAVLRVENG